jgi:branched-subunit amino acid transport protein
MNFPLFCLALALSTFIPRMIPAVFISKMNFGPKVQQFLRLLPYTVMTALIFPAVLSAGPLWQIVIAMAACAFLSWKGLSPVAGVLAAIGILWLLGLF